MNVSRHQAQAERAVARLLWLHGFASVAVVLSVDLAALLAWQLVFGADVEPPRGFHATNALVVLALIVGGAWIETARLREDGGRIARRLRAVPVDAVSDPLHRRLQNLLEELAIAARIGVPRAYVLEDEPTINALTAGMDRNEAVVIVTRGALVRLTRDELQGVLAHEVAHVVSGDVRLNTRLVGLNHGLQWVALAGRSLLSRAGACLRSAGPGGLAALAALPLGVVGAILAAAGSIGELAARAIQAGVGRQREFHADAQAVAITRQVDGIGGALRKVAGQARALEREAGRDPRRDAARRHPYWSNVAHLLLAGHSTADHWLATHPSLRERVKRLYGRTLEVVEPRELVEAERREPELPVLDFALGAVPGDGAAPGDGAGAAADASGRAGAVGDTRPWPEATRTLELLDEVAPPRPSARAWLHASHVPAAPAGHDPVAPTASIRLVQATREAAGAAALVVALVEDAGAPPPRWDAGWASAAARWPAVRAAVDGLPEPALRPLRWPLMELAVARLRPLSRGSRETLLATVRERVVADGRVSLREWIHFSLLRLRLAPGADAARVPVLAEPIDARSVRVLFALVARCAQVNEVRAERAANAAIRSLDLVPVGGAPDALTLELLERAVGRASRLPPLAKPLLVRQLIALLPPDADAEVRDVLRLLCVAIDCPPPAWPPRRAARDPAQELADA